MRWLAYKQVVGSLIWAASMARAEFASAVWAVARHARDPSDESLKGCSKNLCPSQRKKELRITYKRGVGLQLPAYVDSE